MLNNVVGTEEFELDLEAFELKIPFYRPAMVRDVITTNLLERTYENLPPAKLTNRKRRFEKSPTIFLKRMLEKYMNYAFSFAELNKIIQYVFQLDTHYSSLMSLKNGGFYRKNGILTLQGKPENVKKYTFGFATMLEWGAAVNYIEREFGLKIREERPEIYNFEMRRGLFSNPTAYGTLV